MTEKTWLTSRDPRKLLGAISGMITPGLAFQLGWGGDFRRQAPGVLHGTVSDRKARLFAVACCYTLRHLITNDRCRNAVEVSEQFADGLATKRQLAQVRNKLDAKTRGQIRERIRRAAIAEGRAEQDAEESAANWALGWDLAHDSAIADAWNAAAHCYFAAEVSEGPYAATKPYLCELLRDIVGNPFRGVKLHPRWLTANVVDLARTIYEQRAFDRLPILADALMDAGCADEQMLEHCRSDGPHIRGCWVVDLILRKR
jgi:hypothetical protein